MTKQEAKDRLIALINIHGLRWTAGVPAEAYKERDEIGKVLTEKECLETFADYIARLR